MPPFLSEPKSSVDKMGMMINKWREVDFPGLWGNCRGTEHHGGATTVAARPKVSSQIFQS